MTDAILVCTQLVKVYRGATEEVQAIRGVDLTIRAGSLTAILGPSGSGKSTLIRLLAGLDRPSAGSVVHRDRPIGGMAPAERRRWMRSNVAFVHQRPRTNLIEHLDGAGHLRLSAYHRDAPGWDIETELDDLGLAPFADRTVDHLSGGEQQRLAIAAAVVGGPPILVVDEPTAHQDDHHADLILDRLRRSADLHDTAVVYTTHDPRITPLADRLLHLTHGALTSESHVAAQTRHGVIDDIGRIQLPPDVLDLFGNRRAVISVEDGTVVLRPTDPDR